MVEVLYRTSLYLWHLHGLRYFHKDLHSGNILQYYECGVLPQSIISDYGLSGPSNKQNKYKKNIRSITIYCPRSLNGEPHTQSADIYSYGVIMAELSSGKPSFYNKRHDINLELAICDGLRPEFGKGTPEFYNKLAYKLSASYEKFDHLKEELIAAFAETDKEIPNISTSYESDPDAVYTSREFTFGNSLTRLVITPVSVSYINNEERNKIIF
ncbi:hypothetical protein RclHR1_15270006 [Rhizophagus clarus]|uniref:Protein kinase domain-containing protein n=1 Tax=Rhizophagus clarus TaxID=94130 RepID=A0A2Z6QGI1_9GLOM|nr:hypothetical protein RclHR1_15270006 [Rhizophagus clarus]